MGPVGFNEKHPNETGAWRRAAVIHIVSVVQLHDVACLYPALVRLKAREKPREKPRQMHDQSHRPKLFRRLLCHWFYCASRPSTFYLKILWIVLPLRGSKIIWSHGPSQMHDRFVNGFLCASPNFGFTQTTSIPSEHKNS